jgi:dihydropteroate synthase
VGTEPSAIFREILERKLASSPEHFYYLGKELWKAKTALKLGKDYIQDEELF